VSFARADTGRFEIIQDTVNFPGQFRVEGDKIERIVAMTNWGYYEAAERFQRILTAEGIIDALKIGILISLTCKPLGVVLADSTWSCLLQNRQMIQTSCPHPNPYPTLPPLVTLCTHCNAVNVRCAF
jgi:Obg family GTPase CgtA-like protein